ncbi:MAG TPA: hypothetical protein VFR97_14860 [Capillimicrobium sp.]|nr:hypothetical protein [Capillimicrobium sp.]
MLLPALLAAVTLVACGGGGGDDETSGASATEILEKTFDNSEGVSSGRLTVAFDLDVQDASGESADTSLKLTGPFDTPESDDQLPSFDFDLTVSSNGQSIQGGAISTGDQGFLSLQGTDYAVPDDLFRQFRDSYVQAQQQAGKEQQPTLEALGIDPTTWITDPQKAGTEDVGGTETEHVTAGVDVPKLLNDLRKAADQAGSVAGQSGQLSDADIQAVQDQVSSAKVDVYTGKDDLRLRRLVVDVTLKSGHAAFTLEIADLDEPQTIEAPTDTRPLQELVGQFQSLIGASGAGGAVAPSTGGAGSSGGSGSGGANQKYLECVQAAGQDLEKVQACAKYL